MRIAQASRLVNRRKARQANSLIGKRFVVSSAELSGYQEDYDAENEDFLDLSECSSAVVVHLADPIAENALLGEESYRVEFDDGDEAVLAATMVRDLVQQTYFGDRLQRCFTIWRVGLDLC
jgi:hypothetical protein